MGTTILLEAKRSFGGYSNLIVQYEISGRHGQKQKIYLIEYSASRAMSKRCVKYIYSLYHGTLR